MCLFWRKCAQTRTFPIYHPLWGEILFLSTDMKRIYIILHAFFIFLNTCCMNKILTLVSDSRKNSQSGVVDCNISDHQLIFCTRKVTNWHRFIGKHKTVKLRSLKNYNKEAFQQYLVGVDWFPVVNCDNVFDAWNNFNLYFCTRYICSCLRHQN